MFSLKYIVGGQITLQYGEYLNRIYADAWKLE